MESGLILPALAVLSVALLLLQKLYLKLRPRFPMRVNCWFCNNDSSVPYNCSNSWYCPHCDQYNGFSIDGSYNRILPEQSNEKLNCGSWCENSEQKKVPSNGLCRFCNINLELKIQQLAHFVPTNKLYHDEEVQQYSDQLERVYQLCTRCQGVLKQTLDKQDVLIAKKNKSSKPSFEYPIIQQEEKQRHSLYLTLTAALSVGLLLSVMPYDWVKLYPLPAHVEEVLALTQQQIPKGLVTTALLVLSVVVQLFDCAHMRDTTSLINLMLWVILLSLTRVPVKVDGLVTIVHMLASVVFFITSLTERKSDVARSVATVKPVQLHKINKSPETTPRTVDLAEEKPQNAPISPKYPVSDPSPTKSVLSFSQEQTVEDFGFGKLNVSARRVTRSQTKPFQTKQYASESQSELFRPKPFNLSPPKLQFDTVPDYQTSLTRSSSQSSGFVSLSQQKDFEDYRTQSASDLADNIESVSQCAGNALDHYRPSIFSPTPPFPQPFGVPFSNFQPYTVMQFSPNQFSRLYQFSNMLPYEHSLNLSTHSMNKMVEGERWYHLQSVLYPILFTFLITSNLAVLWKVYGEEYFYHKT